MTRHYTLHAPSAGIRVSVTTATTTVLDPGPDERTRRRNLVRERLLVTAMIVVTVVSMELLRTSQPHERPWTLATGLLLGAWACHTARPGRRTVPAALVEILEPLRTTTPAQPAQIHRLLWEACDLLAAQADPDTPPCPACAETITQIQARLRALVTTTAPPRPDRGASLAASTTPVRPVPARAGHAMRIAPGS